MRYDLAAMVRRTRNPRRSQIELRPIQPTATMAGDLYRAAYSPVIQAWQRAIELIESRYAVALPVPVRDAALVVFHRQSNGQTVEALDGSTGIPGHLTDSIFDLDSILAALGDELQRLVLDITPALREWAVRSEGWHRGRWRGAVLSATGIDAGTFLGPEDVSETVEAFIARNVNLMRSVSDDTRTKVSDIVLRNYQQRTPAREVAKETAEAVGISRKRALRVAADQSSKLSGRLDQARQEQAGIERFKWRWSHKKHGRAIHIAHDGKVYPWDKPPQLDGKPDLPGQLPYCGCRSAAVIDLD